MGKNQHVVPHQGEWAVRGEKNKRLTAITDNKAKAKEIAREIAQNQKVELLIHDKYGKIKERASYGNDPFPPRDKR